MGVGFSLFTQYAQGEDRAPENFYKVLVGIFVLGFIGFMIGVFLPNVTTLPKNTGLINYLTANTVNYNNSSAINNNYTTTLPSSIVWHGTINTGATYTATQGLYGDGSQNFDPLAGTDYEGWDDDIPALDRSVITRMVAGAFHEIRSHASGGKEQVADKYIQSPGFISMTVDMVMKYNYMYTYDILNGTPPTDQDVYDSIVYVLGTELDRNTNESDGVSFTKGIAGDIENSFSGHASIFNGTTTMTEIFGNPEDSDVFTPSP